MDSLVSFEQDTPNSRKNKHIPVTATLIASVLLALSPKDQVIAKEKEEKNTEIQTDKVQEIYYSLLQEIEQSIDEQDPIDFDTEAKNDLTADEVRAIQEQLILFIEENEIVLTEEMKQEVETLEELEELFANYLVASEPADESEETEELPLDDVVVEETVEEDPVEAEELSQDEERVEQELEQENTIQATSFSVNQSPDTTVSYTVRSGDTLNKIARDHHVTVSHIAEFNNIQNVNAIRVGQILKIYGSKLEDDAADDLGNLGQSMTKNQFIDTLGAQASVAAKEQNLYASVMIAQAALETGFGTSGLSAAPNHNLYGMKGRYEGQSVVMHTREYSSAKGWYYVNAHFKKYPSYLESLLDHSSYIRRGTSWAPDFYSGVWRENTTSYRDATAWLQGRYATDPAYASKLNAIIESYHLTRFDAVVDGDLDVSAPGDGALPDQDVKPSTGDKDADSTPENSETTNYRVKSGDTLSQIALRYKMSVQELKELNNLKSDLIIVGQSLKVKKSVAPVKPVPTPTPEKPVQPSESNTTSYTVKRGDTLSQIASRYKMSVRELKELNNLKSDLIFVGQRLNVKRSVAPVKPTPPKPTKPTKPVTPSSSNYTVKRGDTLSRIALAYKMSVRELKEINNLKSDLILVGQRLNVKRSVTPVKPTPPKPTAPTKPVTPSTSSYTVKKGDTLSQIALRYKMSVRELKELNKLKSDLIFIGQQLKINQANNGNSQVSVQTYQIKAGDTLSAIARRFNTTVKRLKETNKLTSDLIFVNQRLKV